MHTLPDVRGGARRADERLLERYADSRDPRLREQLTARYLPLARFVAQSYSGGSEPFDDLLQVACLGLLKAIERFDPAQGAAFSSYAIPTMRGEIRRYFRDRTWTVRPPRDLQDRCLLVERAARRLSAAGEHPTVQELAAETELEVEEVLEAVMATPARDGVSLTAPAGDASSGTLLQDSLGEDDPALARSEDRAYLGQLTAVLTKRERTAVRMRFEHDMKQQDIAAVLGVSQMQVSRILRAALAKLHDEHAGGAQGVDG
jgi:RNA polymerase sigma-B factor